MNDTLRFIPCDCDARHALPGSDESNEHSRHCSFRPSCLHSVCPNFGKPMTIADDGLYDCPLEVQPPSNDAPQSPRITRTYVHCEAHCEDCGRNMTRGEPHTAACSTARVQDAEQKGHCFDGLFVCVRCDDELESLDLSISCSGKPGESEREGCGAVGPEGYRCTHHATTEHLARGVDPTSLAETWPRTLRSPQTPTCGSLLNRYRAQWALLALETFYRATRTTVQFGDSEDDVHDAIGDLLCDLLHLARQRSRHNSTLVGPNTLHDRAMKTFREDESDTFTFLRAPYRATSPIESRQ